MEIKNREGVAEALGYQEPKECIPVTIPENQSAVDKTDNPVFPHPFETLKVICEVDWDCDEDYSDTPDTTYCLSVPYDTLIEIGAIYCLDEEKREILQDILADYLTDALTEMSGWCHKGFHITSITTDAEGGAK